MTRILFIRHATNHTVGKTLAGRLPGTSLNAEGEAQALNLAERLTHLAIDAIYSSPLERAIETAMPLARQRQLEVIVDASFLELDFADWSGRSFHELREETAFRNFNTFRSFAGIPGGEMMLEAQLRMIKGVQKITKQHEGHTVAIVGHADLIKAAIAYFAGTPLDLFHRFEISPASVSILEIYEETARIMVVNHTGMIAF